MSDRETRHLDQHGNPDQPPEWVRCEACRGSGIHPTGGLLYCDRCGGAGELVDP